MMYPTQCRSSSSPSKMRSSFWFVMGWGTAAWLSSNAQHSIDQCRMLHRIFDLTGHVKFLISHPVIFLMYSHTKRSVKWSIWFALLGFHSWYLQIHWQNWTMIQYSSLFNFNSRRINASHAIFDLAHMLLTSVSNVSVGGEGTWCMMTWLSPSARRQNNHCCTAKERLHTSLLVTNLLKKEPAIRQWKKHFFQPA